jgi:hypothetical protein
MFIASIYVVTWEVLHRKSFVVEMLQNGYSRSRHGRLFRLGPLPRLEPWRAFGALAQKGRIRLDQKNAKVYPMMVSLL